MLSGEIQEGRLKLVNIGNGHLKNLFMVISSPKFLSIPQDLIEKERTVREPVLDDFIGEQNFLKEKSKDAILAGILHSFI